MKSEGSGAGGDHNGACAGDLLGGGVGGTSTFMPLLFLRCREDSDNTSFGADPMGRSAVKDEHRGTDPVGVVGGEIRRGRATGGNAMTHTH